MYTILYCYVMRPQHPRAVPSPLLHCSICARVQVTPIPLTPEPSTLYHVVYIGLDLLPRFKGLIFICCLSLK
jgi:hypothetical protein